MNDTMEELQRSLAILKEHGITLPSFEMLLRDLAAANARAEQNAKDAKRLQAIESWGGVHIINWGDDNEWTVERCCDLDRDPTADEYAGSTLRAAIDAAGAAKEKP